RVVAGEYEGRASPERRAMVGGRRVAGMMVDEMDAIVGHLQMARHVVAALRVGEWRLARRRIEQAELRTELARAAAEPAPRRLEADGVVPAHVSLVAHDAVHPVVGRDARSGQHDAIDLTRAHAGVAQQRVDSSSRVARVVLQAREALLGRAADDLPVAEHRRGRAVSLADPQNDHDPTIISAMVTWA